MSDLFNHLVDVGVAAGMRLLELPIAVLLAAMAALLAGIWGLTRLTLGRNRPELMRSPAWMATGLFIALALIVDHNLSALVTEVRSLRTEIRRVEATVRAGGGANPGQAAGSGATRSASLFDEDALRDSLETSFDQVSLTVEREAPGVEYAWAVFEREGRPVQVHMAVIDLTQPGLEVMITPEFDKKWKTSDFAARYGCAVAVNGEAGRSPKPGCGLGTWTGNWIVRGEAVLLEDSDERPFLAFDRENHAVYSPASVVDRELTDDKYNTLWGRVDLLLGGEVVAVNASRAPRCCMGIDAAGQTLYLMVVDGRRPGHSQGLDMIETAQVLAMFGATDGMSCDQGGSACMVLASRAGPVSTPCDTAGERGVYSHFGIAIRE
ncbi:MAG: hypothetical protein ACI8QZ_001589 [Chlamydiales bacterium]|jgi:hypothetical protein